MTSIQNVHDNECFTSCLVRYLNLVNRNKDSPKKLDFKDINFLVKVKDIHKIEKKNSIGISVFGYENKEKHSICVSEKNCEEKHTD